MICNASKLYLQQTSTQSRPANISEVVCVHSIADSSDILVNWHVHEILQRVLMWQTKVVSLQAGHPQCIC